MQLTPQEEVRLQQLLRGWADTRQACRMRRYIQHGTVTTYDHCMRVTRTSYWLARRLGLRVDEESLVRGAFLHDFYLYDWHQRHGRPRWHGFYHPAVALANARRCYPLNAKEADIISSHMWPLTLRHVPRCREAVLVCLADKWCSAGETLHRRPAPQPGAQNG